MTDEEVLPTGEEAEERETPVEPYPPIHEDTEQPPEKPCDPATMTCDEMRDKIIGLTEKRTSYKNSIEKLDDVRKILPSEEIEKAHADAVAKKKEIDDEIYGTFEKFTVCTARPPESEKKEESEENPESEQIE